MDENHSHGPSMDHKGKTRPYVMLAVNLGLSLSIMYLAMSLASNGEPLSHLPGVVEIVLGVGNDGDGEA